MKRVLVISSSVAASSVGANNSAFCLRYLGVETVILPTTLLGRHPGWGTPGGARTPLEILEGIWDGVKAQNLKFDAVLTGYMADVDKVYFAEAAIKHVKRHNPKAMIIVDPVMGDHGKHYVDIDVATGIETKLIPMADIVTPNVWEFSHLVRRDIDNIFDLKKGLLDFGGCALVTSVTHQGRIGALSYHPKGLTYFGHEVFDSVPNGGGDALAGTLLARLLLGDDEEEAAQKAVSSIFQIMKAAHETGAKELPLTENRKLLETSTLLEMERVA